MNKAISQFECDCGQSLFSIVLNIASGKAYAVCSGCGNEFNVINGDNLAFIDNATTDINIMDIVRHEG